MAMQTGVNDGSIRVIQACRCACKRVVRGPEKQLALRPASLVARMPAHVPSLLFLVSSLNSHVSFHPKT